MKKTLVFSLVLCATSAWSARLSAQCGQNGDCPGQQLCASGACVDSVAAPMPAANPLPTDVSPTSGAPPAPSPEGTSAVTFTSDEPGVKVSELSTETWVYATMCTTPCTLQLTPGPHYLKLGGWEANTMATGTPQEWRYDSGQNAIWGWGVAGTAVGSAAMATGGLVMVAFRPRLCLGNLFSSSGADCEQDTEPFNAGIGVLVAGAVLLAFGIWGIVASEPVSNVTGTGQQAGEDSSPAFALLPSVGPMRIGDGRTGWAFSLVLTL
jgi:hypothetical protein